MAHVSRRRRFLWSQVAAWAIVGPLVAVIAASLAYVYGGGSPTWERAWPPERLLGTLAAAAVGPASLAGPLVFGWTRPHRVVLVVSVVAAAAVSALVHWYFNHV